LGEAIQHSDQKSKKGSQTEVQRANRNKFQVCIQHQEPRFQDQKVHQLQIAGQSEPVVGSGAGAGPEERVEPQCQSTSWPEPMQANTGIKSK